MEYFEGSTIARYRSQRNLTIVERIGLMRKVCQDIAHAHQKGVLHCDLEPSGIVVTELDGVAPPKIIDFRLARALDRGLAEGYLIGTIANLTPEQADERPVRTSGPTSTRSASSCSNCWRWASAKRPGERCRSGTR